MNLLKHNNDRLTVDQLIDIGLRNKIISQDELDKTEKPIEFLDFLKKRNIQSILSELGNDESRSYYANKIMEYSDLLDSELKTLFIKNAENFKDFESIDSIDFMDKEWFLYSLKFTIILEELSSAYSVLKIINRLIHALRWHNAIRCLYGVIYFFIPYILFKTSISPNDICVLIPVLGAVFCLFMWFVVGNALTDDFVYRSSIGIMLGKIFVCSLSAFCALAISLSKMLSMFNIFMLILCVLIYFWAYFLSDIDL